MLILRASAFKIFGPLEKPLFISSPYPLVIIILLGYGMGCLEVAILRKNFQFSTIAVPAIGIGIFNIVLLYIVLLIRLEFFSYINWFAAVIAVVIIVIGKLISYRTAYPLGFLCAVVAPFVFFKAIQLFVLLISLTIPDEGILETSVRNDALIKLRFQMWMGGSDVNLQRPVEAAFQTGNMDALAILYAYSNDAQVITYGTEGRDEVNGPKAMQLLITHGKRSNPAYRQSFYYSLLHGVPELEFALKNGDYPVEDYPDAIVEAVLAAADYASDSAGQTTGFYEDFDRKISLLKDHGFDINGRKNGSNASALMNFLELGNSHEEKVLQILLKHGADVNLPATGNAEWLNWSDFPAGTTPLMMAARLNQVKYARILLDAGADTGRKDSTGKTAFDYATDDDLKSLLNTR